MFDLIGNLKKTKNSSAHPAILLKKAIVFPEERVSLVLEDEVIHKAIDLAEENDNLIVFVFQKNGDKSEIGILAEIIRHWSLTSDIIGLTAIGQRRVKVERGFTENSLEMVEVSEIRTTEAKNETEKTELEALSRTLLEQFKKIIQQEKLGLLLENGYLQKDRITPDKVSDLISSILKLDFEEKLMLLETLDIKKRLEILNKKLASEVRVAQAEERIQHQIEEDVTKTQREFILRERLKAIEKELGIFEEQKEYEDLEKKIMESGLPKDAEKRILAEFHRLKQMSGVSAEAPYIRTYLEWIVDLPWSKKSGVSVDLQKAQEVLDADHYGLEKAKERVLEYLAVQKLTRGKEKGSILCFVGPPGTGKTSVGKSIAKALNRNFVRISLGGIRDEAEIRGHRRTYVGALPGRIIQGMRTAGVKNPVFMMDEIDKIGADFRGDPGAALLEALDPAQNNSFSDHYIEIPFDLSDVFFITTANILDPIPPALRDRMEVIEFPGYTEDEKFHIAKKFLIPRVLLNHGLTLNELVLKDNTIIRIISRYTREAGVRELERKISEIARKTALRMASDKPLEVIIVDDGNLADFLGPEEYEITTKEAEDGIGVAAGLAWTPVGGEIIFIEATQVTGKGNLTLTGQLGEVMQESARAALSYLRSKSKELKFDDNFYYKSDIHIHVPSGAIPKDGSSAGVAIACALASMLTKKKIKKELAFTGEVTLSGRILKVGGIKEKIMAAQRGGAKIVVLPADNKKNLIDVPREVRDKLDFRFVRHMNEALKEAF